MVDIDITFKCEKCGCEWGHLEIINGDYLAIRCEDCGEWEQI